MVRVSRGRSGNQRGKIRFASDRKSDLLQSLNARVVPHYGHPRNRNRRRVSPDKEIGELRRGIAEWGDAIVAVVTVSVSDRDDLTYVRSGVEIAAVYGYAIVVSTGVADVV